MNKQPLAIIGTAAEKGGENKSKLCPPEIHTRTDQGTKSLLKTGMRSGSQKAYREALLLEKYRDALLEQANELRSDIQSDISQKAKNIAPRIFGWNNTEISGLNSKLARRAKDINGDYENIWETLIGLESHEYRLEDPDVAAGFFSELQNNFLRQDLKNVDSRFISKYAWLKTSKSESLIDLPVKAPKKSISTPSRSLLTSKKTSSQQRLEKELVMQEIALKNALNNKFKPISIPDSSIIPKYDKIMENQSTRSTKIRELLLKRRMEERCKAETIERDLQKQLRKPLGSYTYVHSSTSRRLNSTERREAVLKEIMKECTFSPIVSSKIPNFKREHQKFKGALEKGKSQRSTTIPQPFQLSARLPAPTKKETIEDSTSSRKNAKNLTDCESKVQQCHNLPSW